MHISAFGAHWTIIKQNSLPDYVGDLGGADPGRTVRAAVRSARSRLTRVKLRLAKAVLLGRISRIRSSCQKASVAQVQSSADKRGRFKRSKLPGCSASAQVQMPLSLLRIHPAPHRYRAEKVAGDRIGNPTHLHMEQEAAWLRTTAAPAWTGLTGYPRRSLPSHRLSRRGGATRQSGLLACRSWISLRL